jgi:hypothetical protein
MNTVEDKVMYKYALFLSSLVFLLIPENDPNIVSFSLFTQLTYLIGR